MTLTIKEPSPLDNLTKPGSKAGSSESNSDRTTRSNPVCLEVAVTIRSLPGEKAEASSGSAQPTREDTRTVIVFDNGAVLRLAGNFPPGQAVIISNLQGREVVCQVVSARNLPNVKGYIEVEFQEPIVDFWGIHNPTQQTNVSNSPAAVVTQPQAVAQARIVPSEPPPSAPPVPARMSPSVPEIDLSAWNAPSFHDVAALDRVPPPSARGKVPEAASRIPVSRNSDESKRETVEAARPYSPANAPGPASDLTSLSGTWEGTPPPSRTPSSSNDILGKFSGSTTTSGASSSESRGKTPLIIAGAAVVLIGLGTGLFFMHQGNPATPSATPVVAASRTTTPNPPAPASVPALSVVTQPTVDQPPRATPVLSPVSEVPNESVAASAPSPPQTARRPVIAVDAMQPDRPAQRPQLTHNLKMNAPTVESQGGRLVDGSVPNIDDVAAISGVNGTPGVGLISTVLHANNPPAPPVAFAGPSSSGKTAIEPKLVSSTRPAYPALAKQANIEGDVLVAAEIDAAGNVVRAKAVGGPMFLQQAATDAVRKWKYEPATLDGRPASAQITVKIQFRLK